MDTKRGPSEPGDNPIEMLTSDHQRVKQLFRRYEAGGPDRERVAKDAMQELEIHSTLEEEIFYPAVRRVNDEGEELVSESVEEHQEAKDLIEELKELSADDEDFDSKFKELIQAIEHHAEEEEQEMFPVAQQNLGQDLPRLGAEMKRRKQQLMGGRRTAA